jgi:hypothetical protein
MRYLEQLKTQTAEFIEKKNLNGKIIYLYFGYDTDTPSMYSIEDDLVENEILYDINFPLHWALTHGPGSGPIECQNCAFHGSVNGCFVGYCTNCSMYQYNMTRGIGFMCGDIISYENVSNTISEDEYDEIIYYNMAYLSSIDYDYVGYDEITDVLYPCDTIVLSLNTPSELIYNYKGTMSYPINYPLSYVTQNHDGTGPFECKNCMNYGTILDTNKKPIFIEHCAECREYYDQLYKNDHEHDWGLTDIRKLLLLHLSYYPISTKRKLIEQKIYTNYYSLVESFDIPIYDDLIIHSYQFDVNLQWLHDGKKFDNDYYSKLKVDHNNYLYYNDDYDEYSEFPIIKYYDSLDDCNYDDDYERYS